MKQSPQLNPMVSNLSEPTEGKLNPKCIDGLCLEIVHPQHPLWPAAIDYVKQRYELAFAAHLEQFMPAYLVLEQHGRILSLCGFRIAADEPLFLEQYLQQPAERLLSATFSTEIERSNLIEFGHLASFTKGTSPTHFYLIAEMLVGLGYEWCIFTATDPLHALMTRLGLEPQEIAKADPSRIENAQQTWGLYYEHQPRVLAGNLKKGLTRLRTIFQRLQKQA